MNMKNESRTMNRALRQCSSRWLWCFILLHAVFCLPVIGQSYSIDWFTIDAGGGTSTGGVYQISGTIGQPDVGPTMSSGDYSVDGGFWSVIAGVQTPDAPTLTIIHGGPGEATVSWTPG